MLVNQILDLKKNKSGISVKSLEEQIDEIIFDLYNLTEEERELINTIWWW